MTRSISKLLPALVALVAGFGPHMATANDAHHPQGAVYKIIQAGNAHVPQLSSPAVHKHYAYVAQAAKAKPAAPVVKVKTLKKKSVGKKFLFKHYGYNPYQPRKFRGHSGHVVKKKPKHHGKVHHKGFRSQHFFAPQYRYR
ncbi:hypothetical protein [Ruegeria sp. HKCCD7255]|uniref:hypothetical protein n=1 Tax=Ruegeria sp. HKCCD7255 TaxID=2683004 RepID=UPI001489948D|nr:hypothetical protein [Ruegeria sp. HKCCD7255]